MGGSDKPAKISCKKIEKFPSKIEKKYETTNFSKKCIFSKCFSRQVECSFGNPLPHTHRHTNRHTKTVCQTIHSFSGSPRLKIQLILFRKFFFLKNFSWTNKLQFRQLHPFFCRMLESFDPKLQPVVKSWDFYQKKFFSPKDSVGLVKACSTTLLKLFCQKVESIFFKVQECYDIVNFWKESQKTFLET